MAGQGSLRRNIVVTCSQKQVTGHRCAARQVTLLMLLIPAFVAGTSKPIVAVEPPTAETRPELANSKSRRLTIERNVRSSYVEPGDDLSVTIRGHSISEFASQTLTLRYELYRLESGKLVSQQSLPLPIDSDGNSERVGVTEAAPSAPGVYEIRCTVFSAGDEPIWSRLRRRETPLLAAASPLVVISDQPRSISATADWKQVGEIRPSHLAAWSVSQWLPLQTKRLIPNSPADDSLGRARHDNTDVSLVPPRGVFQATLPVARPGLPHLVSLRYPSNQAMRVRIEIGAIDSLDQPDTSFTLTQAASPHPDDPWSLHTFVYYPRVDDQIRIVNLDDSDPVLFESLAVKAGPEQLDPCGSDVARRRLAILHLTTDQWIDSFSRDVLPQGTLASCETETIQWHRRFVASRRLIEFARANGMNAVAIPALSTGQDESPGGIDSSSDAAIWKGLEGFLKIADGADLQVFLSIDLATRVPAETADAATMPNRVPESLASAATTKSGNSTALRSIASVTNSVGKAHQLASAHSNYAGVVLNVGDATGFASPEDATIADDTLLRFASVLPPGTVDADQLRQWVAGPGRAAFDEWRQSQSQQMYHQITEILDGRPLLLQNGTQAFTLAAGQAGDPSPPRVTQMKTVCRGSLGPLTDRIRFEQLISFADAAATRTSTAISLCDRQFGERTPTPLIRDRTATDVSRLIDRFDPAIVCLQSASLSGGVSRELAEVLAGFCSLPRATSVVEPTPGAAASPATIRTAREGDELWLLISNRAPWRTAVEFECSAVANWDPIAGGELTTPREISGGRSSVTVPAGSLVILKSRGADTEVKSWTARVAGGQPALDHIKQEVSMVVSRLGMLSDCCVYPALSNGGFEQSGGVGLVGWLHAQHPPDSVQVDPAESVEGKRSVLLTTDQRSSSRTWLVSETFDPPDSGRLAVSMACRGERVAGEHTHRVRVSIEGTMAGKPLRESAEFDVPRDGKWQARSVVLQLDGVNRSVVHSLRLTIDSLTPGRIWIDDVRLHDRFPLTKERGDLQSQAFLAVQGLQRGNLTPSSRLLQNHWAKFLLTESGSAEPAPVIQHTDSSEPAPGVAERIRSWLPRPLRF